MSTRPVHRIENFTTLSAFVYSFPILGYSFEVIIVHNEDKIKTKELETL